MNVEQVAVTCVRVELTARYFEYMVRSVDEPRCDVSKLTFSTVNTIPDEDDLISAVRNK